MINEELQGFKENKAQVDILIRHFLEQMNEGELLEN
jgi:hypothetical protein